MLEHKLKKNLKPKRVIILGKIEDPPADGDIHQRMPSHGYGYGMRLC